MDIFNDYTKLQQKWLENCIKAHSYVISMAENFIHFNWVVNEKMKEHLKAKDSEDK